MDFLDFFKNQKLQNYEIRFENNKFIANNYVYFFIKEFKDQCKIYDNDGKLTKYMIVKMPVSNDTSEWHILGPNPLHSFFYYKATGYRFKINEDKIDFYFSALTKKEMTWKCKSDEISIYMGFIGSVAVLGFLFTAINFFLPLIV